MLPASDLRRSGRYVVLHSTDCVIDAGANIGYFDLLRAMCAVEGIVGSIEPSRVAVQHLNVLAAQVPRMRARPLAMSSSSRTVNFVDEKESDRSHIAIASQLRGYVVERSTVDEWVAGNELSAVDLVKVDAEGHDVDVIQGAAATISLHEPGVEFEAFDREAVEAVTAILADSASGAYEVYRCCNEYPTSVLASTRMTNNWFAIPARRASRFADFLFRRGFLIAAEEAFTKERNDQAWRAGLNGRMTALGSLRLA